MNSMSKIKVIACSGIGKVNGSIAREAVLKVTDDLCSDISETVCLGHIVTGDDDARQKIEGIKCVTVDGCTKMCAAKNSALAGGIIKNEITVVDTLKNHRGAKPGTATVLTEEGWQIVNELAENIAEKVKKAAEEE
jgi:uncharacterized metal-binding protein